ncbi:hypothetical protein Goshw_004019 [Gossypium schwendimanii]|uniref:Uncharacterized protein n=1 Tax=Gossypium schwendimanii TaxID=34291 RepID=A0A7J9KW50_GOSSC|nr:hypothetical protein [Gossypium schwendimanii]
MVRTAQLLPLKATPSWSCEGEDIARRAYRALRSLVKLQAVARGAYVRKQVQIAMNCMHALVRLQVKVRARQLLGRYGE